MNKSPLIAIAAIIASTLALASSAEAGFGIRLGFGGPLPSFVAHGSGGSSYSPPSYRRRYAERCHKHAKAKSYASKHKTSEPKVAKVEKKHEPKVAKVSKRKAAELRYAERRHEKRQIIAKAPIIEPEDDAVSENSSIAAADEVAVATTPEPKVVETTEPKAIETTPEPKVVKTAEVKSGAAPAAKPAPEKTASKLDCKKFFPSVGMTLSVPCE